MSYRRNSFEDLVYNPSTTEYEPATGYGRNPQLDLVYNSETETYDRVHPEYCTLTVNTTPADASVTFSTGTSVGHVCTVTPGTYVTYTVSKIGYISQSWTVFVDETDVVVNASINKEQHTVTIVPGPQDSTVVLTAAGFTQVGNSITVDYGTQVSYVVSHQGYISKSASISVIADRTITVTLKPDTTVFYKITINPSPDDAIVQLVAPGFTQVGNSIQVPARTLVQCTVSAENYQTEFKYISVTGNATYPVILERMPLPTNQIVFNNTILCSGGQTVTYWVNKDNFIPVTGTLGPIISTREVTVPLLGDNLGSVKQGSRLDPPTVDNKSVIQPVNEGSDLGGTRFVGYATVEFFPDPSDALVQITYDGVTQSENQITVALKSHIYWRVTEDHYVPVTGDMYVVGDQKVRVKLEPIMRTITVRSVVGSTITIWQDNEAVATGTGAVTTELVDGTQFIITVSAENYDTYTSEPLTVTESQVIEIPLTPAQATFVIYTDTPGAVISFNGESTGGNTIQAPIGATVTWEVSAVGYQSKSGSHVMSLSDTSLTVNLDKIQCTYTIQPNVVEATIQFTLVSGQEITRTSDSITVEYGSVINWIVNATGYVSEAGNNITVTEDTIQEVELVPGQ